jgi:methylthioribose-1-phosphate isomerase
LTDPVQPPDPDRRRFFRQFAGDVAGSFGSMLGAAQALQQESADAARELLGTDILPGAPLVAPEDLTPDTLVPHDAATAGWRAPFRWDGDVCRIVDQRQLPDVLVDLEIRTAYDAVTAVNEQAVVGAPVQAQVAAVTLAIVAAGATPSRTFARRAVIRGAGNGLKQARPGAAQVAAAVDRMLAVLEVLGIEATGETIADAMTAEAAAVVGETTDAHGALVGNLLGELPGDGSAPLRVLVLGSTGAMGGGQFGTALSAVQTAHHGGREVHAVVAEGRPGLEGARIASWELTQAGVPHAVVTDAAAPGHVAARDIDAVLVAADRVAGDGDVIAPAGAYPLALAAEAAGVPFLVCATTTAFDPGLATGAQAALEEGRPGPVIRIAGTRVTPDGTAVRNRTQDLVPARLVTAIVTEQEVIRRPDDEGVRAVMERVPGAITPLTPRPVAPAAPSDEVQDATSPAASSDAAAAAPDAVA